MNIWSRIAHTFLPPVCALCGAPGLGRFDLCAGCAADLPRIRSACLRCGLPLAADAVCGRCLRQPPCYEALRAPYLYAPPLAPLITGLKFGNRLYHARLLGQLLEAGIEPAGASPDCLLPVPLHPTRLRERGFNQAVEIARPIAARLQVPLDRHSVRRNRMTGAQSSLPARRRGANVRGAFTVTGGCPGRHVVIVDDVVTTGHTVNELARTLRRSGVLRVEVWAVARAVPEGRGTAGGNRGG